MIAATKIPEPRLAKLMRATGMGRVQAYHRLTALDRLRRRSVRPTR